MEIVSFVGDCIQALCAVVATVYLFVTLNAWKKERRYERQAEAIGTAIELAEQARDAIKSVRHWFGHGNEGKTRPKYAWERPEHDDALNNAYTPVERLARHDELFSKMRAHRYRMIVEFGQGWRNTFDPAFSFNSRLVARCHREVRRIKEIATGRGPVNEDSDSLDEEFESLRWESDENDAVNKEMKAMVQRLTDKAEEIKR